MNGRPPDQHETMKERRRAELAHWLRERWIEQNLHATDQRDTTGDDPVNPGPPQARWTNDPPKAGITAGQIRLLHPRHLPPSSGPLYVALLSARETETFTVAPFSRFSVPALDSELRTERAVPCLRVLSVGFARPLTLDRLADSWWVDNMMDAEHKAAVALFHHAFQGATLPNPLADRVGAPLIHPRDPRHAYREEMAELMDALWVQEDGIPDTQDAIGTYEHVERCDLPLAAEPRAHYGTTTTLRIEDAPLLITASRSPDGTRVDVTIRDHASRISRNADGSSLVAPDGRKSPQIRHGRLRWTSPPDIADCLLHRPDGSVHRLIPA